MDAQNLEESDTGTDDITGKEVIDIPSKELFMSNGLNPDGEKVGQSADTMYPDIAVEEENPGDVDRSADTRYPDIAVEEENPGDVDLSADTRYPDIAVEHKLEEYPGDGSFLASPDECTWSNKKADEDVYIKLCLEKRYGCNLCEFMSDSKAAVKKHVQYVHLVLRPFPCDRCEYRAPNTSRLKEHVRAKHFPLPTHLKGFRCDSCDVKFVMRRGLVEHVRRVHLKVKNHKCEFCGHETYSKGDMNSHLRCMHDIFVQKPKKLKCNQCKYEAACMSQLERHVDTVHLKVKNFKCDHCSYKAYDKYGIDRHVRHVHLNIKMFQCSLCPIKKINQSSLNTHIQTVHLKTKNFVCDQCSFKTYDRRLLKQHVEIKHLKLRKFRCLLCNFTSNYKSKLKLHGRKKHSDEVFYEESSSKDSTCEQTERGKGPPRSDIHSCKFCVFETSREVSLIRHVRNAHPGECTSMVDQPDLKEGSEVSTDENRPSDLKKNLFSCSQCKLDMSSRLDLEVHCRSFHTDRDEPDSTKCSREDNADPSRNPSFPRPHKTKRQDFDPVTNRNEINSKNINEGDRKLDRNPYYERDKSPLPELVKVECETVIEEDSDLDEQYDAQEAEAPVAEMVDSVDESTHSKRYESSEPPDVGCENLIDEQSSLDSHITIKEEETFGDEGQEETELVDVKCEPEILQQLETEFISVKCEPDEILQQDGLSPGEDPQEPKGAPYPYQCEKCKLRTNNVTYLRRHSSRCQRGRRSFPRIKKLYFPHKKFYCHRCTFEAVSKSSLTRHVAEIHLKTKNFSWLSFVLPSGS